MSERSLSDKWTQGAIFDIKKLPEQQESSLNSGFGVIASHDCDLANLDWGKEPTVEWFVASSLSKTDPFKEKARSPRELQIPSGTGYPSLHFHSSQRQFTSKKFFTSFLPSAYLNEDAKEIFVEWIIRRYSRSAFPDEFNRRRSKASRKVRKLLDSERGRLCNGLYVLLQPMEELSKEESYRIAVLGTVSSLDSQMFEAVDRLMMELGEKLSACEGIDVQQSRAQRESDFSLADLQKYRPFGDWDDLSLGADA